MKLKDFFERCGTVFDRALAVSCAVLLLASSMLLVNQLRLKEQLDLAVRENETLPAIQWYEETTDAETVPATTAAVAQITETPTAAATGKTYVLNTSSKKIHSPDCRYAASIKEENKILVENADLEELRSEGYEVCSVCGGG